MTSILTNAAAMTALSALSNIQSQLNTTQRRIATGKKVNGPADDPGTWTIATRMQGEVTALGGVATALNYGAAMVQPASGALDTITTAVQKIQADLVQAQQSGQSTSALQQDIAAQQQAIVAVVASSSFNGTNLLDGTSGPSVSVTDSFQLSPAGVATLGSLTIATTGTGGIQAAGTGGLLSTSMGNTYQGSGVSGTAASGSGANAYAAGSLLAINIANASSSDLATLGTSVAALATKLQGIGTTIGNATTTINTMQTFESSLASSITSGIGLLVDADMNLESTRLQALQTQQQLAIQSLAIANNNSALVLKLFQ